ncbi:uncharacterized protein LOC132722055 isoform X4 [Ruditapes philippinarum]|uniref:uncharacterized protein LOC132722055 isoform X4 n=1 Tax=Ruditapes philippinarum TaxID=129788 RepID=UPI00295AA81B|nr:uncharacterized protein LOC132722055 isoform X4 [Ruditapes philippinarum]
MICFVFSEMLEDQAKMMKHLEGEIDRLRAQDDMAYRRGEDRQQYEPRAQSDIPTISVAPSPLYVFTAKRKTLHKKDFVGFLFPNEPQTERMYNRRPNRDREIFGQSKQSVPEYLNVSPRRHPVGRLYNKDSTYKTDFDVPFGKHGPHNLGNPNKEPMEPYNPFGMEGGGAPMVDSVGQRRTRIAGSMGYLGREMSDSARARRAHKRELLQEIGEQAAFERARKEREKAYNRQEFVEVADAIRQKKVGYPRFNQNGLISQHHHLPHMFNTVPYAERMEQKKYHDFLERQIEDRNAMTRIGQFEEQRQAKEHYRTIDGFFGRRGGGNVKGPDTRKINLDKAIHNPQSTSQYYNKVRLEEEMAPHEILNTFKPRITINSTHKNLYEYPQGELKTNYSGRTPYAAEF